MNLDKTCGGKENLVDKWKINNKDLDYNVGQELAYGGIVVGVWRKELGPIEVDNLSQKAERALKRSCNNWSSRRSKITLKKKWKIKESSQSAINSMDS